MGRQPVGLLAAFSRSALRNLKETDVVLFLIS
jgi:hypothetical protein